MIRYLLLLSLISLTVSACTSTKSSTKGAVVPPIKGTTSAPEDSMPALPKRLPPMPPPSLPEPTTTGPVSTTTFGQEGFRVQIFASVSQEGADSQAQRARTRQSDPVDIQNIGGLWKVRLGPYPDRQNAEMVRDRVRQLGWSDAWIVTPNSEMGPLPSFAPSTTESFAGGAGAFSVQVAASHFKEEGQQIMNNITSLGINKVYLSEDAGLWKVRVGTFPDRVECEKMREQLRNIGFADAFIITEQK